MKIRYILLLLLCLPAICAQVQAQELNAKLTINTQKVSITNQDIISSLQKELMRLLNEQKWTDATFARGERIDCTFAITISEMPADNRFNAEIQVASRRPVYNSSYISPLLNLKDSKLSFEYTYGESLNFSANRIDNNLVAVIAYYVYIVIGLDFDSFSLNGGKPYFTKAMEIVNLAQGLNSAGWESFSNDLNRYTLANAMIEESSKDFHTMWYKYHRLGLDEMAANVTRGRVNMVSTVEDLNKLYQARPNSPLLIVYAETKLDELIKTASKASTEEKQELKKTLRKIFPTKGSVINDLK